MGHIGSHCETPKKIGRHIEFQKHEDTVKKGPKIYSCSPNVFTTEYSQPLYNKDVYIIFCTFYKIIIWNINDIMIITYNISTWSSSVLRCCDCKKLDPELEAAAASLGNRSVDIAKVKLFQWFFVTAYKDSKEIILIKSNIGSETLRPIFV